MVTRQRCFHSISGPSGFIVIFSCYLYIFFEKQILLKTKKNQPIYYKEVARVFYFIALVAFTVSLAFNQPEYFLNKWWSLVTLDVVTLFLILLTFALYLFKIISLRLTSAVFIYSTILNLSTSVWFFYFQDNFFSSNFLFNTFIFSIYIILAGFCIGRTHVFFVAAIYILTYIPLILISQDPFLMKYLFLLPFLILVYAFAVSVINKLLYKSWKKEIELKNDIVTKEKVIIEEQNKRLNCELEAKKREAMTKSMLLLEHVENNNAFIQKLNTLKPQLSTREIQQLNSIIDTHRTEHLKKHWEEFETTFLEVSPEFYQKLFSVCPNLSNAERKLAAFVYLGLSSKQIGRITSTSPKSIEVARSRLRSRLNLSSESNLRDYLVSL